MLRPAPGPAPRQRLSDEFGGAGSGRAEPASGHASTARSPPTKSRRFGSPEREVRPWRRPPLSYSGDQRTERNAPLRQHQRSKARPIKDRVRTLRFAGTAARAAMAEPRE